MVLCVIIGGALVRTIAVLALKVRQIRYSKRATATPTGWQDLCTEPEPPLMGIVVVVLLASLPTSPPSRISAIFALLGLGLSLGGWLLNLWALRSFPTVSTGHYILPEQRIVTAGPYGHLRNPIYAGVLLMWISLAAAFQSLPILGLTLLYVLPAYLIYIRAEERMLLSHFGEPYARYCEGVGRFFPKGFSSRH
jgi:protein-S-isoprenylcysteine O-methyltransferase Ste14